MFSKIKTAFSMNAYSRQIKSLRTELSETNNIVIGAGSGLSTAAGFTYSGERFHHYFADFHHHYPIIPDIYSGGFFDFPTQGEYWAWWSRHIWINRYQPAPNDTYQLLFDLVKTKNYFVLTTNVDHQFQMAGFDKHRLVYTQGDYGLFQKKGDNQHTYNNYPLIRKMILDQGFIISDDNQLIIPDSGINMTVNPELCAEAKDYTLNLRADDTFVEDRGWHTAAERFNRFIDTFKQQPIVFLELGVGLNTPTIIKYPFWKWTRNNPSAKLVSIDKQQIIYPKEIDGQTLAIRADIHTVLKEISE